MKLLRAHNPLTLTLTLTQAQLGREEVLEQHDLWLLSVAKAPTLGLGLG
jgi:hypothetical protein